MIQAEKGSEETVKADDEAVPQSESKTEPEVPSEVCLKSSRPTIVITILTC